jgi:hypothetical protein
MLRRKPDEARLKMKIKTSAFCKGDAMTEAVSLT